MQKKRIITIGAVMLVIIVASAFYLNRAVIFQRGNPIPYIISAIQISEKKPYVAVDETKGIYISKRGECPELFDYFCEITGMELVEQAGSGYIFTDGKRNDVISSEIYWGRYTVWTLPDVETVEFHGEMFSKTDLSEETLEWLDWYNSLTSEEQLAISYVPNELYSYETSGVTETVDAMCEEPPDLNTPILKLHDILYYDTNETGPMGVADAVEGYIQTSVKENEIPAEDEESNFGCVGNAYTKDNGDGWIMVLMDDEEWHIFKRKETVGD